MDGLEFTPKCVLPYQGYIVVGVDGELQKLEKTILPC